MSDSADKDDFDWGAPMPHEMKVTFAIIEKLTDDFAMTMWKEISAASSMSLATAKQRFGRLRDKYLEEMPSVPAGQDNQADDSQTNDNQADDKQANDDESEKVTAPATTTRLNRGRKRAAPRDEEEVEDDGDNVPSQPPASKRIDVRRSTGLPRKPPTVPETHNAEEELLSNEKVEQFPFNPHYDDPKPWVFPNLKSLYVRPSAALASQLNENQEDQDPTLSDPFAKPAKNAKGRTPLPSDELVARRKAAKLARQRKEEQK